MVAFSPLAFITAVAALASTAFAAPTRTSNQMTPRQNGPVGATHSIVVGRAGQLVFDPENVVAEIGDTIEWHFTPRNHSVVQSNFANPCVPAGPNAFFSGFVPTMSGQNGQVFQIKIYDKNPIWYYCSQTNGNHCQMGMAGVINQNFDSNDFTLRKYKENAGRTSVSQSPPAIYGGLLIPNPNPLSGFKKN
ncbi:hypothetical protein Dda_9017 [Drechslerella dactyloides]|uniref:Extracellular serine-rich protein n=1 Tax=Drechslerella dactyloides TaxID=74499 RepID=A0AAD6ITL0_DREDA|nr:hypothetical protein Dda_9017 [Drechslerella dactyloides]